MTKPLMNWDIYEIISKSSPLTSIKLRGRVRVFSLKLKRNVLLENAEDMENRVRFAVPSGEDTSKIIEYLAEIVPDAKVVQVMKDIPNPILSKLKVNRIERYQ